MTIYRLKFDIPHKFSELRLKRKKVIESNLDVIDKAISGDIDAFGILYQENVRRIYTYIYYRTGNSKEAEDLTGRVFFRAIKHIKSYKKTSVPFSAWLYRIAHNLVANWYRDNSKKHEIPIDGKEFALNTPEFPESDLIKKQALENLIQAMRKLSNDRQQLIILKFVEDLSNKDIGKVMGRSEGAIKSLYHRTLIEMKELIDNN